MNTTFKVSAVTNLHMGGLPLMPNHKDGKISRVKIYHDHKDMYRKILRIHVIFTFNIKEKWKRNTVQGFHDFTKGLTNKNYFPILMTSVNNH